MEPMAQSYSPLEMLERLVAFDTTSRNSNLELISFVQAYLAGHGIAAEILPDETGAKANLIATIGPQAPGGIVLSAHSDVVPVDGQPWDTEPFKVIRRDGRLYGRGTADMKTFPAVALALVPQFLAARMKRPVHIVLSYDEEVGCLGAPPLVKALVARGLKPEAAIIGEPTMMRVVNAHKAIHSWVTEITGHEAHSSNVHKGVSAVMAAGELLGELSRIAADLRAKGDPSGRFDPPFSTAQSSIIQGGTAINILARRCTFGWETRTLPGGDPGYVIARMESFAFGDLLPRMRAIAPACEISFTARSRVPALMPEPGSPAEALALSLAGLNAADAVSYATEAGIFQEAGIPAIVCGPGDIAQAHQPNEFIDESQLAACERFMHRLMARLAG